MMTLMTRVVGNLAVIPSAVGPPSLTRNTTLSCRARDQVQRVAWPLARPRLVEDVINIFVSPRTAVRKEVPSTAASRRRYRIPAVDTARRRAVQTDHDEGRCQRLGSTPKSAVVETPTGNTSGNSTYPAGCRPSSVVCGRPRGDVVWCFLILGAQAPSHFPSCHLAGPEGEKGPRRSALKVLGLQG